MQTLYDTDFSAWALRNAELLRAGRVAEADISHISEELEGLARKDRNEFVSHLVILLLHLLKWQFQLQQLTRSWREFSGKSWENSIDEQRYQIQRQLKFSPSLKPFLPEALQEAWPDAVKLAVKETRLARSVFPAQCPYTLEQVLDEDFYPETETK